MSRLVKRPAAVTRLGLFVLIFTSWHIYRLITIGQEWILLQSLPLRLAPVWLVLEAALWASLGRGLVWMLATRNGRFPVWIQNATLAYLLLQIGKSFVFRSQGLGSANLAFESGLATAMGLLTLWVIKRPSVQQYFGELYER